MSFWTKLAVTLIRQTEPQNKVFYRGAFAPETYFKTTFQCESWPWLLHWNKFFHLNFVKPRHSYLDKFYCFWLIIIHIYTCVISKVKKQTKYSIPSYPDLDSIFVDEVAEGDVDVGPGKAGTIRLRNHVDWKKSAEFRNPLLVWSHPPPILLMSYGKLSKWAKIWGKNFPKILMLRKIRHFFLNWRDP